MSDPWDNPSAYEGQEEHNKIIYCPACKGQGFFPGKIPPKKCNLCLGTGYLNNSTPNPQETVAKLLDLADMPRYNPITNTTGRSDRDVSEGKVYLHPTWKVACLEHGAMNCVNEQRTIWRCLTCGRGAYAPEPLVAEPHVVQTPQESSPGFEEAARQILFRVHSSQPLGLDYKDAVKAILAVHNDEIQAAKRELIKGFIGPFGDADPTEIEVADRVYQANSKLEEETT